MTVSEITHVLNHKDKSQSKIGMMETVEGGTEHPLWSMLNIQIKPIILWKDLYPAVRKMVVRAAELLHANGIPYSFYGEFLKRFKKTYLKSKPMTLLAYKQKKDGSFHILSEYIYLFNKAKEFFVENPDIIKLNDALYEKFDGFSYGTMAFVHSLELIRASITSNITDIYIAMAEAKSINDFWNTLGKVVVDGAAPGIDDGYQNDAALSVFKEEMKIRKKWLINGSNGSLKQPNGSLDRYFKKNGSLNAYGLKVLSGEVELCLS